MTTVSIKEAKNRLTALARLVEQGETVTITRYGQPIVDLVPHRKKAGVDFEALEIYKRKHGINRIFGHVADDFDEPSPEDFLLKPSP